MVPSQCLQACHDSAKAFGLNPQRHASEIQSVLNEPSVQTTLALMEKMVTSPNMASTYIAAGDERLLLTLAVVKGLCDYAAAEAKKAKLPESPLLCQVCDGLEAMIPGLRDVDQKPTIKLTRSAVTIYGVETVTWTASSDNLVAYGASPEEAVGKLIVQHSDALGIVIQE